MLKKIISGGQTGADFAGLIAGKTLHLETGGTVPRGRMTESGPISQLVMDEFHLVESKYTSYPPRTRDNVRDSDGTVLFGNMTSPGCRLTITTCQDAGKPYIINPDEHELRTWVNDHHIVTLNVAGNRASRNPKIFETAFDILTKAFLVCRNKKEIYE